MRVATIIVGLAFFFTLGASSAHARGKKKSSSPVFSGHNADRDTLRKEPLPRPSGEIHLVAENLNEEATVNIYKADGSFDEAALAKLDELFRCTRTGDVRAVRAELYEQLSRIYDHFGKKPVILVSGYRLAGERTSSRHYHASAMDIRISGVSAYAAYTYAQTLDMGGMGIGIYPTTGFIHVDYRAPNEPSFRWTDYSGHAKEAPPSPKPRTMPARKPTS
jgi:uncharacterized protein YcbK (DUF882 family)